MSTPSTSRNEEIDCDIRIRAAYENGTLNGMKISRRYSMVMQLNSASNIALRRYAKLAAKFNRQAGDADAPT